MEPVELHEPRTRNGHEVGLKFFDLFASRGSLLPDDHSAFALELLLSSRIIAEGAACPAQDTREERRPNNAQYKNESVSSASPLPSISFVVARVRDTASMSAIVPVYRRRASAQHLAYLFSACSQSSR